MGDYPLWPSHPYKGLGHGRPPLPTALAACDLPYRGPGCNWSPLYVAWPWVAAPFLTAFAANHSKNGVAKSAAYHIRVTPASYL
ncbi:hypothetical protein B296_00024515 [Ensete ventricosum]|uniref:Uncharacterized protein n=1 Tax=Ensete ventricosum TaxID=4639 RepID=A0A426ZWH4_ENSVE|nr:hypothetical protein B296_00024515 [Ensete ventricosum]